MSRIGLGCAWIGGLRDDISDEASVRIVRTARDRGVALFDTAPRYGLGLGEKRLHAALSDYPRADYVLSTKVGYCLVPSSPKSCEATAVTLDPRPFTFGYEETIASVEASLSRLGVDNLDLVFLQ